jgi:hypothetical protein
MLTVIKIDFNFKCISDSDDVFVDLAYFILEFFFTELSAYKHWNKTTSESSHKKMQRMNEMSSLAGELFPRIVLFSFNKFINRVRWLDRSVRQVESDLRAVVWTAMAYLINLRKRFELKWVEYDCVPASTIQRKWK